MKKKRTKKSCALKRREALNRAMLKDKFVFYMKNSHEKRDIILIDKRGNRLDVSLRVAQAIQEFMHKWSVVTAVFGYEKNGKQRMVKEQHRIDTPLFQSDIVGYLNDAHQSLINDFKQHNEAVGAGWIASPFGVDFDDDFIDMIFNKFDPWGNSTGRSS